MLQIFRIMALAATITVGFMSATEAAEREQVRMVINLIAGVKMPFPENLRNNVARTERVQLDTNGSTFSMKKSVGATNTLRLWVPALRCCASETSRCPAYWSARFTSTSTI